MSSGSAKECSEKWWRSSSRRDHTPAEPRRSPPCSSKHPHQTDALARGGWGVVGGARLGARVGGPAASSRALRRRQKAARRPLDPCLPSLTTQSARLRQRLCQRCLTVHAWQALCLATHDLPEQNSPEWGPASSVRQARRMSATSHRPQTKTSNAPVEPKPPLPDDRGPAVAGRGARAV